MIDKTLSKNLEPLCRFLEDEIKSELSSQGHKATGALSESIRVKVQDMATWAEVRGTGVHYAKYVDSGRRAGIKRVPLDALIGWIRAKGINLNGRKERDVAYAIQLAIFRNGIPTNKNTAKTGFVTRTLDKNTGKIREMVNKAAGETLAIELHNVIWNIKQSINA